MALRGGLRLDTRRVASAALMTAPGAEQGDTPDLVPGTAVFAVLSGFATPAAWDVKDTYGGLDGSIAGSVSGRIFSSLAVSEASAGSAPTRGSMPHRSAARPTAGTAVIVSPATLALWQRRARAYMGPPRFESIFPIRFGVVGFVDVGRVWLENETSRKWHPSGGGGLLAKPVGTGIVLRAVVASGDEGILLYIGSGFRF